MVAINQPKLSINLKNFSNSNIALAVSGGADSLSMMYLFNDLIIEDNISLNIVVLSVDHCLRKSSYLETEFVKAHALALGFDFVRFSWDYKTNSGNLQEKARNFRYKEMLSWCKKNNFPFLCVAHNANDNAETILMNLLRGSGIDGLYGIKRFIETSFGVSIIRPMIGVSRNQIVCYLASKSLMYIEDPSNFNKKYSRVIARHNIDNLSNSHRIDKDILINRINQAGKHIYNAKSCIDSYVEDAFINHVKRSVFYCFEVDIEYLKLTYREVAQRIVLRILKKLNNSKHKPRLKCFSVFFEKLLRLIAGCKLYFNGIVVAIKNDSKTLYFYRDWKFIVSELSFRKSIRWDNRFILQFIGDLSSISEFKIKPFGLCKDIKDIDIKAYSYDKDILYSLPAVFLNGCLLGSPLIDSGMNGVFKCYPID